MDNWSVVSLLQNAMHDEANDQRVVWNAAVALSTFKCRNATQVLLEMIREGNSWRQWKAINCLRDVPDKRTIPILISIMKDADVDIRKEIALTLGKIGGEEVVSGVFRLLNDESSEVRWRSAMALWLRQGMKVSFLS